MRLTFKPREGASCAAPDPPREAPELKRLGEACSPSLTGTAICVSLLDMEASHDTMSELCNRNHTLLHQP